MYHVHDKICTKRLFVNEDYLLMSKRVENTRDSVLISVIPHFIDGSDRREHSD